MTESDGYEYTSNDSTRVLMHAGFPTSTSENQEDTLHGTGVPLALMRLIDTRASTMLDTTMGSMDMGKRRMLNNASDVNALRGVRVFNDHYAETASSTERSKLNGTDCLSGATTQT